MLRAAAIVALACTLLPPLALAQERSVVMTRGVSMGGAGPSRLSLESVERYAGYLELDETQRDIARTLFEDFRSGRVAADDAFRAAIERVREDMDEGQIEHLLGRMAEVSDARASAINELESMLLGDLRAMLTPEQDERWPRVERRYRRDKSLGEASRALARVDIEDLLHEVHPDAAGDSDAAEILRQWELRVDAALQERARRAEAIEEPEGDMLIMLAVDDGADDPFAQLRAIDARIEASGESTLRALAGVLGDEPAAALRTAWLERGFPRVYRPTSAERRLEAALAIEDLDDAQRSDLVALRDRHVHEADAIRATWVAGEREEEAESTMPPGVQIHFVGEGEEETARSRAGDSLAGLDRRIEDRLAAILSAAQLEGLPAADNEPAPGVFVPQISGSRGVRIGG
ncbi:MAG: hypothetical protein AAFX79_05525 [Planctomycetota bacterium]